MTDSNISENSILQSLNDEMRCGIFTNGKGQILIIHEQNLRSDIQWVEYDPSIGTFALIHEDGSPQDLGIDVHEKMRANLNLAKEVTLAKMVNKNVESVQTITFLIKDY